MASVMGPARRAGIGVGAFNVIQIEHAEAIVTGAERAGRPVLLQISENTARYHGGLAPLALACLRIAESAAVDVVVHLDLATERDLVEEAVALGVRSVMYDASRLDHDANVRLTAEVTVWCHAREVWVEAELGEVGGKAYTHQGCGPIRGRPPSTSRPPEWTHWRSPWVRRMRCAPGTRCWTTT